MLQKGFSLSAWWVGFLQQDPVTCVRRRKPKEMAPSSSPSQKDKGFSTAKKLQKSLTGLKPLEDLLVNWKLIIWIDKGQYHIIRIGKPSREDKTCLFFNLLSSFPCKGSTRSWTFWSPSSTSYEGNFRRLPPDPGERSSSSSTLPRIAKEVSKWVTILFLKIKPYKCLHLKMTLFCFVRQGRQCREEIHTI